MSTNMNQSPPPPGPPAPPPHGGPPPGPPQTQHVPNYPPEFKTQGDAATKALAVMLKICHQQDPNSPLCDALQNMIKAVAEIEARTGISAGSATGNPDSENPADVASEPGGEPPPAEDQQMSGNPNMAKAANEAFAMMQAKKRPQGA